jgi:hypothetical protein
MYLAVRMSKVAFGRRCGLPPLVLLPFAILQTFQLDHPRWLFFSYNDLFTLSRLDLGSSNHDLLPIELDHVHVCREHGLVELPLGLSANFNCPLFMAY